LAAAVRHARALIDGDAARLSEAAGQYLRPLPAANAAEDAGIVLAGNGDWAAARLALNRALQGYRRIAAEPDVARIRARLHKLGVRSYGRTRQGQTQAGWPSLTDAERQVARVVAEGRTNGEVAARLFVSRHTVDFHLRRIFRKLGVASRTELTRFVLEREMSRACS
jgi:DNA-binding CsgD family transcriptional regulator